jgi:hypothetical protein
MSWYASYQLCPECKQPIVRLNALTDTGAARVGQFLAYPRNAAPPRPLPPQVPDPYRQEFTEAVSVLPLSAKASAALSRRTLQAVLRDKAGTTTKDLNDQIKEVIDSGKLPSHISDELHAVRNIGNFAAHPMKSQATGAIVDVEPGEARVEP